MNKKAIRGSNIHGCIAGTKCNCPRSYRRCSLFTDFPEYSTDKEASTDLVTR